MTPEEKFSKNVFYIMQKIKELSLYTKTGHPISYKAIYRTINLTDGPKSDEEVMILGKLTDWKAIEVQKKIYINTLKKVIEEKLK